MKTSLLIAAATSAVLASGCAVAPQASAESDVPVVMAPAGPPPPPPDSGQVATVGSPPVAAPAPTAPTAPLAEGSAVAPGSLDELVGPVALYPDPLLALLLPASTASSDIVLAARYLDSGGDGNNVADQPWDESVKGLAHYPDVVKWMDANLAWTQRLGAAYVDQPQEVMAAVQRDRARAQANGSLVSTPQQQVVVQNQAIEVLPAQPDVIYVPRYDPEIVYVDEPVYYYTSGPLVTFGIGFGVGSWLAYDCDWRSRAIWVDRHRSEHWRPHEDWRSRVHDHPSYSHDPGWHRWTPPPGRARVVHNDWRRHDVQPAPMPGAPHLDRGHDWRRDPGQSAPRGDVGRTHVAPGNFGLAAGRNAPVPPPQPANSQTVNSRPVSSSLSQPAPVATVTGPRGTLPPHFAQPVSGGLQHTAPTNDANRLYGRRLNPSVAQAAPAPVVQPPAGTPATAVPGVPATSHRPVAPGYPRIRGGESAMSGVPAPVAPVATASAAPRYIQPARSYPAPTTTHVVPAPSAQAPVASAPVAVAPVRPAVVPAAQAPAPQVRAAAPAAPRAAPAATGTTTTRSARDTSCDSRTNEH